MNEKKFCFIMCACDTLYRDEALLYISRLDVPDGYETEVLTVEQAVSMTAGYNEGMAASDAKYKIYLHQDVFLIHRRFLYDILDIFRSDERIGMIGAVGSPELAEDGVMWHGRRYGMLYGMQRLREQGREDAILEGTDEEWNGRVCGRDNNEIRIMDVQAVDGLLMVTQHDVPWREDILKGWDFYDISQGMEILKRGYRVVIAKGDMPWCVHDCGFLNMDHYEQEREVFMKEYGDMVLRLNRR